jgi:xylulokinase
MAVAVGLDVGTSGVKGIVLGDDGTILARAVSEYGLSTPRPGWAEQDPEQWWTAAQEVLARLREQAGRPTGIGLSGQMHGLVALDAGDSVLRPAILWNDQRTGEQCRQIEERVGRERLIAATGNRALPGFTAPKLLWLREHEPDVFARIANVLLPKDYVRLRLTGEHATDVADASGTLLLDVAHRRWSDEVIAALDLDASWLPPVLESPEVSGHTAQGVPVAAGAGDQAAGALGVGADRPGPLSVVLGTSGVVFAAQEAFVPDPDARVHTFCHAVPGAWHAMGVMLSAAGSLAWLRDVSARGEAYDALVAEAAGWPPGAEGLTFLPYLVGERTPHADPDARASFTGLGLRHDRGALVRAVLEGVAYGLRDSLDLLTALGRSTARPVVGRAPHPPSPAAELGRASGGGARSQEWLRIVASVLELPLETTDADEGAAFGAALLGGVASGAWADVHEAVAATVRPAARIEPVEEWVPVYREGIERYRALYPALRALR